MKTRSFYSNITAEWRARILDVLWQRFVSRLKSEAFERVLRSSESVLLDFVQYLDDLPGIRRKHIIWNSLKPSQKFAKNHNLASTGRVTSNKPQAPKQVEIIHMARRTGKAAQIRRVLDAV